MTAKRRSFGQLDRLPSGRWRVRFHDDLGVRHNAPQTFDTKQDGAAYLDGVEQELAAGTWEPDTIQAQPFTFAEWARPWVQQRKLKPRTRSNYSKLLEQRLIPFFGNQPLAAITPPMVRRWHNNCNPNIAPTNAMAYTLLRTILNSVVEEGNLGLTVNPCSIRGAGSAKKVHQTKPATLAELEAIVTATPDRYKMMIQLAAWCAMRLGELAELRRKDVTVSGTKATINISRGVILIDCKPVVGTPKTSAGTRTVAVPAFLVAPLVDHLERHTLWGPDALLFPSKTDTARQITPPAIYYFYYPARAKAGRPDLRFHDLRHTGATWAAQSGATTAELMGRLGHTTAAAAMIYQHATSQRDAMLADRLDAMYREGAQVDAVLKFNS